MLSTRGLMGAGAFLPVAPYSSGDDSASSRMRDPCRFLSRASLSLASNVKQCRFASRKNTHQPAHRSARELVRSVRRNLAHNREVLFGRTGRRRARDLLMSAKSKIFRRTFLEHSAEKCWASSVWALLTVRPAAACQRAARPSLPCGSSLICSYQR